MHGSAGQPVYGLRTENVSGRLLAIGLLLTGRPAVAASENEIVVLVRVVSQGESRGACP